MRRRLATALIASLGLGVAPLAGAVEEDATPKTARDRAGENGDNAPATRDDAPRAKGGRSAPLLVPSEEVSADAAISFPADI